MLVLFNLEVQTKCTSQITPQNIGPISRASNDRFIKVKAKKFYNIGSLRIEMPPEASPQLTTLVAVQVFRSSVPTALLVVSVLQLEFLPKIEHFYGSANQCDQIWQFIGLWETFQSLWQQLI